MGATALLGQGEGRSDTSQGSGTVESMARARLGQSSNARVTLRTGGSVMDQARMQGVRALEGTKQGRAGGKKSIE